MLENSSRIYVQHPTRPDNLLPAVVESLNDRKVRVRFLQPVAIPSRKAMHLFFQHPTLGFSKIGCQLNRMETRSEQPEGLLMLVGEPTRDDGRAAFRVGVHDGEVSSTLAEKYQGEVLNVSCTGMAADLDTDEFTPDDWVDVELVYDCQSITGRMQVRNWARQRDGRIRYGFAADPDDGMLLAELTRITTELQKAKARRASGRGLKLAGGAWGGQSNSASSMAHTRGDTQASGQTDASTSDDAGKDTREHGDAEPPEADGKRRHRRKPWSGLAKVYLRENQNLRVLDVNTIDLSPGGISFLCATYIYRDSELLFEKPIPGGLFRIRGIVRSVHVDGKGKHRVGIQFSGAPLKPNESVPELECIAA